MDLETVRRSRDALQTENAAKDTQIGELQGKIKELEDANVLLQKKIEIAGTTERELSGKKADAERALKQLRDQEADLLMRLDEATADRTVTAEEKAALDAGIKELQGTLAQATKDIEGLSLSIIEKDEMIQGLEEETVQLKGQLEEVDEIIATLEKERDGAKRDYEELLDQSKAQLTLAAEEILKLREELAASEASLKIVNEKLKN